MTQTALTYGIALCLTLSVGVGTYGIYWPLDARRSEDVDGVVYSQPVVLSLLFIVPIMVATSFAFAKRWLNPKIGIGQSWIAAGCLGAFFCVMIWYAMSQHIKVTDTYFSEGPFPSTKRDRIDYADLAFLRWVKRTDPERGWLTLEFKDGKVEHLKMTALQRAATPEIAEKAASTGVLVHLPDRIAFKRDFLEREHGYGKHKGVDRILFRDIKELNYFSRKDGLNDALEIVPINGPVRNFEIEPMPSEFLDQVFDLTRRFALTVSIPDPEKPGRLIFARKPELIKGLKAEDFQKKAGD